MLARYVLALKRYRSAFKNWWYVALARAFNAGTVRVITRSGGEFTVDLKTAMSMASFYYKLSQRFEGVEVEPDRLSFFFQGRRVVFYGYRHGDIVGAFSEYGLLDVNGYDVLDVGASIGDTAVYFAVCGARRVVAVEPYPFAFEYLKKNIEANGLSKIEAVNAGVGGRDGVIRLSTKPTYSGTSLKESAEGVSIPVYSLDTLVEKYGPFYALKMDCEGCEYEALSVSRRLGAFDEVQVEYHYGYEPLLERFKEFGFDVIATPPRQAFNANAENPNMKVGFIIAGKSLNLRAMIGLLKEAQ